MIKRYHIFFALLLIAMPLAAFAQESGFVPLTNIENLKFAGNQGTTLPAFLNSVYMICIGLAAVIGVLQIMRAGVTWMTAAGSHEKIGEAKGLVRDTIIGLVLVLAPTIVFSIINPDILKLEIRGLEKLNRTEQVAQNAQTAANVMWVDAESNVLTAGARCQQEGGQPIPWCKPSDGSANVPIDGKECKGDVFVICVGKGGTATATCENYKGVSTKPAGSTCDGSKGETRLQSSCSQCSGMAPGDVCCGTQYSVKFPPKAPGCSVAYGDGADLKFDQTAELCCNKQQEEGISCKAEKVSKDGVTSGLMCSCAATK